MEQITMEMIIGAIVGGVGAVTSIGWLIKVTVSHRVDIKELFGMNAMTMTKTEIAELVKLVHDPIKEDVNETKETIREVATNVNNMSVMIGRMDERMKTRRGGEG
jgi:hypothetical protein